ncbi:hypothetical protein R6Q57_012962 [Mikania cordata]
MDCFRSLAGFSVSAIAVFIFLSSLQFNCTEAYDALDPMGISQSNGTLLVGPRMAMLLLLLLCTTSNNIAT